ncbi:cystathionine beta-synthase [Achroia grisella]|uniref:cystathionine beta-synthase n=1 Tax=Achroia grisella TaxID=688607 RepID=UPI0027D33670|nr:cystathionine beta-synthase [Achroia grisella]
MNTISSQSLALFQILDRNKCTIVTTDKSSDEKANTMRLLGSEVISLKTTKSPTAIARQIKDANPDTVVMVSQFDNDINPKTHYEHTAEEILSALPKIDMVAMGAGTGGTFSGISAKIKSVNSKCVIVGADPDGSTMFNVQGPSHPFLVEGIGGSRIPITLDKSLLDEVEVVTDEETFLMARELVKLEGILCGGSSGTAMVAAIKAAKKHNFGLGKRIVVIMPDGIRNYMSKFVSDQWMEAHLFKEPPQHTMVWWKDPITNLVVYNNYPNINTNSTCEDALLTMVSANDGDVAIVVNDKGWLVGAVSKDSFRHNATNPTKLPQEDSEDFNFQDPVTDHLIKNCYTLTKNGKKGIPTIGLISRILDITPFVIVGTTEKSAEEENFRPEFVVTGNDVLNYIYCLKIYKMTTSNYVETKNGSSNGVGKFFNLQEMPHIVKALDRNQKIQPDILHVIGNTPLVKLTKIPNDEGILCDIYAKCEFLNPGGSVKDRIAYRMVIDAEQQGILIPGKSVIIEPTSGNTGIGLALAAAVKGYRCIIVLPEKMSDEKVNTLKALGAEIVRTPTEAAWNDPESNIMVARRMATEIPDAVVLDQYNNPCNPLAHYDGTAEEILWSLDDNVDMVVIGAGTCGTISGVAHKIKERCPKCVIVGVDPYGSILAQPEDLNKSDVQVYEVEGIGYDFLPRSLDRTVIDKWVKTDDHNSLQMARRLIRDEGLLCGGSSGSAMWGAIQAAKTLKAGQKCVVLLPDNIRNYMTKFISDQWLEARNFKKVAKNETVWWWEHLVIDDIFQPAVTISDKSTPLQALEKLKQTKAPLLTIVNDAGSVVGVFTADNARQRLANLSGSTTDNLDKFTVKKFYKVDLSLKPTLGHVSRMLDIAPYVIVVKSETTSQVQRPVGVATSDDLLTYTTDSKHLNGK